MAGMTVARIAMGAGGGGGNHRQPTNRQYCRGGTCHDPQEMFHYFFSLPTPGLPARVRSGAIVTAALAPKPPGSPSGFRIAVRPGLAVLRGPETGGEDEFGQGAVMRWEQRSRAPRANSAEARVRSGNRHTNWVCTDDSCDSGWQGFRVVIRRRENAQKMTETH